MAEAAANGLTFHVQRLGESGPPLVMAHGLLVGSLATWYFTAAPALAAKNRVLLYDLRGHGRSARPLSGYGVAEMARDLEGLAAAFPGEKLRLCGHSYGALVCLRFALENPERVERLALVEAPLPPSSWDEMKAFFQASPERMIAALPEGVQAALRAGDRRARRSLEAIRALAMETSLLADLRAEGDVPDTALARLAMPVLLVYGESSALRPVGNRLARVLPHSRLAVLRGGHYLPTENAAALTATLLEFFP